ncbi:MAG: ferritin-like domain-containing protein [Halanaerobiales bacterium]
MSDYHEPQENMDEKTLDTARILNSLKEEIEAVNWYNQRASATSNQDVKAILEHNRDEEIEHAAMALEWLRRNVPAWEEELDTYLFTNQPITEIEEDEGESEGSEGDSEGLNIGNMK